MDASVGNVTNSNVSYYQQTKDYLTLNFDRVTALVVAVIGGGLALSEKEAGLTGRVVIGLGIGIIGSFYLINSQGVISKKADSNQEPEIKPQPDGLVRSKSSPTIRPWRDEELDNFITNTLGNPETCAKHFAIMDVSSLNKCMEKIRFDNAALKKYWDFEAKEWYSTERTNRLDLILSKLNESQLSYSVRVLSFQDIFKNETQMNSIKQANQLRVRKYFEEVFYELL